MKRRQENSVRNRMILMEFEILGLSQKEICEKHDLSIRQVKHIIAANRKRDSAPKIGRPSQSEVPQAMLDYLLKNYSVGDEFVSLDLYPIAKLYSHAPKPCTNNQLRVLVACGCVTKTAKRIKNDNGGSNLIVYSITGKTKVEVMWKERPHKPKVEKQIKPENISLKLDKNFIPDEKFFGLERRMLAFCIQNTVKKNVIKFHKAMI